MADRIVVLRDGEVVHDGGGESTEGVLDLMKAVAVAAAMPKLAFKGLLARKLRTVLTGFAVVLGVAFVAGTFIFTDTIDASFKDLFERTSEGRRRLRAVASSRSRPTSRRRRRCPPTRSSACSRSTASRRPTGSVSADVNLLDDEGEPILSHGPPTIVVSTGPERFDPLTYVGRREAAEPTTRSSIDKGTADEFDFKVGDKVTVAGRAPAEGLHGLRHRHARRLGEPRRLAPGGLHAARGASG